MVPLPFYREFTFEKASDVDSPEFQAIVDRFSTLKDVRQAIQNSGVDKCRIIFGKLSSYYLLVFFSKLISVSFR